MIVQRGRGFRWQDNWICNACRIIKYPLIRPERRQYVSPGQFRRASQQLPSSPARTRFAPSPTGYMHLGSLRTALFNFLLAKATGGQFLLRIEDTDTKRTILGAEERICRDLEWAGLHWDEGPEVGGSYGPYRQSERTEIYSSHANALLDSGHAYRCFCSVERLDNLARARSHLGLSTDYDRTCANITKAESDDRARKGETYTIRLMVPDMYPKYEDLVYGRVGNPKSKSKKFIHGEQSFEDPILIKSDGQPTYHLANVVDDHHMRITHVVRAIEWMPSTPKHLVIYDALGWQAPKFAHVGLLQDSSGQKLSKRNMDIDIESFRNEGIFPETLVNHVSLLGWSHSGKSDFFTLDDLIKRFDLKFTKGNTVVNFQKLYHLQKLHAQHLIENERPQLDGVVDSLLKIIENTFESPLDIHVPAKLNLRSYVKSILKADSKQYTTAAQFFERNRNFFQKFDTSERKPEFILKDTGVGGYSGLYEVLSKIPEADWNESNIKSTTNSLAEHHLSVARKNRNGRTDAHSDKGGVEQSRSAEENNVRISRYLRWMVMNSKPGPPIALTMDLLGRTESLKRLQNAKRATQFEVPKPNDVEVKT